jgi:hypothetical protein
VGNFCPSGFFIRIANPDSDRGPVTPLNPDPETDPQECFSLQASRGSQKTLQQREAEYAEARLRILGNQPPTAVETKPAANGQRVKGGGGGQPRNNGHARNGAALPPQPRGPDGSKGFQTAR